MKLIIATPFYEMKGYSPYIKSLVEAVIVLNKSGIDFEYWALSGDSYVDRVRNTICERFLESNGTDLLFIDSDMSWDAQGFANILKSPFEVTGASYPQKNNWEMYSAKIETFEDGSPKVNIATGLIKAEWVPAGFLRIKRSCLERFKRCYPDKTYQDVGADMLSPLRVYTSFFECQVIDGFRCGEDVTFCKRWAAAGGDMWVEPRITFGHYGIKEWGGNYHEYLHSLLTKNENKQPELYIERGGVREELKRINESFDKYIKNSIPEKELA